MREDQGLIERKSLIVGGVVTAVFGLLDFVVFKNVFPILFLCLAYFAVVLMSLVTAIRSRPVDLVSTLRAQTIEELGPEFGSETYCEEISD